MLITGGCISAAGGDGIKALGSSKISACGVHIRKNAGCGVVVSSKSLVMLTACTVSGNVAHGVSAVDANVIMKCSSVIGNNMCVGPAYCFVDSLASSPHSRPTSHTQFFAVLC